jgi:hypothetical protein
MAKLTNKVRRLDSGDFPKENKDLITKLGFIVNPFFNFITDVLSNKLTFKDNMNAEVLDISLTAPINPTNQLKIKTNLKTPCIGLICVYIRNETNQSATLTTPPFIEWSQQGDQIILNNITGLTAANDYLIRVILLGG